MSDLNFDSKFTNPHVGGYNNPYDKQQNLEQQREILNDSDRFIPPHLRYPNLGMGPGIYYNGDISGTGGTIGSSAGGGGGGCGARAKTTVGSNTNGGSGQTLADLDVYLRRDKDKYDPYLGYLYDEGLMSDGRQLRRFETSYININSEFRSKKPSSNISETYILSADPIEFRQESNRVFIRQPGHNFTVNEIISLTDVFAKTSILRTFRGPGLPTFEIPAGCNFMKIYYNHGVPLDYRGNTVTIEIIDVRGDSGSKQVTSYLGNVPINVINTTHQLRLTLTQNDVSCDISSFPAGYFTPNEDYFFVVLLRQMQGGGDSGSPYNLTNYNFKLKYKSIAGIPLNYINANYPIDPDHLQGFHTIKTVNELGFEIDLRLTAQFSTSGGGKCVTVGRISDVNVGYPDANNYIIDLGRTYHNVVSARLISSEIPNSENPIRDLPEERRNNKIYWNNIDDADTLYSISVPSGNYTPTQLINRIESLFLNTPRATAGEDVGGSHTRRHFMKMTINESTDEVRFSLYKESIVSEPIIQVTPDIPLDPDSEVDPTQNYILTILHNGHGMTQPGETILIQNAISHLGIPSTVINAEHVVTEIIDNNTYTITLPKFNLNNRRDETKGGVNVNIYIPDLFRLRFDQTDTLGTVLGFRDPGEPTSITPYSRTISNKDPYEFDLPTNSRGEPISVRNNGLQMSGENYVILVANPLETFVSIGAVKNAFAKILLCDLPGKILYNTFVPTVHHFKDPLHELSELEIQFKLPDGSSFNFNGLDHSLTLEIVTLNDIPQGTGINANTGKNYNMKVA